MEREYIQPMPGVEGRAGSLWIATTPPTEYPALQGFVETDVAVIGGGLVGVMTAALLVEQGKRVVLVDARNVGCGASGHTTAKITVQHGAIYHQLRRHVGEFEALVYLEANLTGFNLISDLVDRYRLDCDYHRAPFCLFAADEQEARTLEEESKTLNELGMSGVTLLPEQDRPFPMASALRMENQALFHPVKFISALLKAVEGERLRVFENTRALDVEDGEPCTVTCEHGQIRCRQVVVATQFPFYDKGGFFSRLYPYHDYAIAVGVPRRTIREMLYGLDNRAVRTFPEPGDPVLVVSGGKHKVGQGGDEREKYAALFGWTRERYEVASVGYHWSTEDYHTTDSLPYIGRSPGSHRVFLAAGFGGWGMTNSAVSAILLSDFIAGRANEHWAEVFDPSRARPRASWREFLAENANVASHFVGGKLAGGRDMTAEDLQPMQGAIVHEDGKTRAAFRDASGRLTQLDRTCTHMGCSVTFNEAEGTWDCPCHGSRFSATGEVVHGPALKPLAHVQESART
jgi:glycine/D-amino acid oxidase-like deaminating enzyme/nitrite reductase/ring-hydroxylating ferredoxin subunit